MKKWFGVRRCPFCADIGSHACIPQRAVSRCGCLSRTVASSCRGSDHRTQVGQKLGNKQDLWCKTARLHWEGHLWARTVAIGGPGRQTAPWSTDFPVREGTGLRNRGSKKISLLTAPPVLPALPFTSLVARRDLHGLREPRRGSVARRLQASKVQQKNLLPSLSPSQTLNNREKKTSLRRIWPSQIWRPPPSTG
jgi:hypothetical protein